MHNQNAKKRSDCGSEHAAVALLSLSRHEARRGAKNRSKNTKDRSRSAKDRTRTVKDKLHRVRNNLQSANGTLEEAKDSLQSAKDKHKSTRSMQHDCPPSGQDGTHGDMQCNMILRTKL